MIYVTALGLERMDRPKQRCGQGERRGDLASREPPTLFSNGSSAFNGRAKGSFGKRQSWRPEQQRAADEPKERPGRQNMNRQIDDMIADGIPPAGWRNSMPATS